MYPPFLFGASNFFAVVSSIFLKSVFNMKIWALQVKIAMQKSRLFSCGKALNLPLRRNDSFKLKGF